jgi:hypothetical protein
VGRKAKVLESKDGGFHGEAIEMRNVCEARDRKWVFFNVVKK